MVCTIANSVKELQSTLTASFAQLRGGRNSARECVESFYGRFYGMQELLERHENGFAAAQVALNQLETEREAREAELKQLGKQTSSLQEQLARLDQQLQEVSAGTASENERWQSIQSGLVAERDQALAEVQRVEAAYASAEQELQQVQTDRARVQADLAVLSEEATTLRDSLQQVQGERDESEKRFEELRLHEDFVSAKLSAAHDVLDAQTRQILDMKALIETASQGDLSEASLTWEAERRELEEELELAQQRAADMAAALVEQKRQASEERAHWSSELRQLKELLQRSGAMPEKPANSTAKGVRKPSAGSEGKDPILGSVMAQFEQLKQQRAQQSAKSER